VGAVELHQANRLQLSLPAAPAVIVIDLQKGAKRLFAHFEETSDIPEPFGQKLRCRRVFARKSLLCGFVRSCGQEFDDRQDHDGCRNQA